MPAESVAIQRAAAAFIADRHRLGAFIGGLVRNAHATEDILQEVWVRLAAAIEKGAVLENQPAWCRGVARNLIRRHWERRQNDKVVADSALLEVFLDRVEAAFTEADDTAGDWAERQRALDDCVAALPERSRRMLSLRYEGRRPVQAVAETMGLSLDAVTKALYRLRRSLADCVERKLSKT